MAAICANDAANPGKYAEDALTSSPNRPGRRGFRFYLHDEPQFAACAFITAPPAP
ncbi:MAG: hypothetical protein U1F87_13575 [Kiritimatiellia bacterium]